MDMNEMARYGRERGAGILREGQAKYPEWFGMFNQLDPDICTRDELLALMKTAPSEAYMGYLYGKFSMRTWNSDWSGSVFESENSLSAEESTALANRFRELFSSKISQAASEHPDWFGQFNVLDPILCERDEMMTIMCTAPDDFCFCYLFSMLLSRLLYSEWSGSGF